MARGLGLRFWKLYLEFSGGRRRAASLLDMGKRPAARRWRNSGRRRSWGGEAGGEGFANQFDSSADLESAETASGLGMGRDQFSGVGPWEGARSVFVLFLL